MSHEDYKEMIPAHAISALDSADDRALTDHLAQCAECQKELYDWQQTAASLALSSFPAEPSPLVRQEILSKIRAEREESTTPRVIPFKSTQKNIWSSCGSLGAIAAAVLVLVLAGYLFVLWRENRTMRNQLQRLLAENQKTQRLMTLLQTPGTKVMELSGTSAAPSATAKLAFDQTGHAMVMADGLPAAPGGKEYQLWFLVAGKPPMRGKTFSTDSQGKAMMEDQLPPVALNGVGFAVTLEPQGGSESPTMPIFLHSSS